MKTMYFGIKYPFEAQDEEGYFIDLNKSKRDYVRSQLIHVIFTPKGQKIRDPEFGSDLIKYIFEPNDAESWSKIKGEISNTVGRYVNGVILNDVTILKSDTNPNEIFVRLNYGVKEGNLTINDTVITKI